MMSARTTITNICRSFHVSNSAADGVAMKCFLIGIFIEK